MSSRLPKIETGRVNAANTFSSHPISVARFSDWAGSPKSIFTAHSGTLLLVEGVLTLVAGLVRRDDASKSNPVNVILVQPCARPNSASAVG